MARGAVSGPDVGAPTEPDDQMEASGSVAVLLVTIAGNHCAVPIGEVVEVLPAAHTEPLPGAPDSVIGVLDLRSELLVVLDGRRCLGHQAEPLRTTDHFVVLRAGNDRRAVRVDAVHDVVEIPSDDVVAAFSVMPDVLSSAGIARLSDGLLVVHDPARWLSASEAAALHRALADLEGSGDE